MSSYFVQIAISQFFINQYWKPIGFQSWNNLERPFWTVKAMQRSYSSALDLLVRLRLQLSSLPFFSSIIQHIPLPIGCAWVVKGNPYCEHFRHLKSTWLKIWDGLYECHKKFCQNFQSRGRRKRTTMTRTYNANRSWCQPNLTVLPFWKKTANFP